MPNITGKNLIVENFDVNDMWAVAVVACSSCLFLLSLFANCTIVRGLVAHQTKSTLVVVLGAMTLSNLLVTLILMPLTVVTHASWCTKLEAFGCKAIAQTNLFLRLINFASIVFLGTDRYLAVGFPDFYKRTSTVLKAGIIITVSWLAFGLLCLITFTNDATPNFLLPSRCRSVPIDSSIVWYWFPCVQLLVQIILIILVILTYRAINMTNVASTRPHGRIYNINAPDYQVEEESTNHIANVDMRASRYLQPVIILRVILSVFHAFLFFPLYGDRHRSVLFFEILVFFLSIVLQSWMTLLISPKLRRYLCMCRVKVVFNGNRYPQIAPYPQTEQSAPFGSNDSRADILYKPPIAEMRKQVSGTSTQIKFSVSSGNMNQVTLPPFLQNDKEEHVRRFSNTSIISIAVSSRRGSTSSDMEMSITYPVNLLEGGVSGMVNNSIASLSSTCSMNMNDAQDESPGRLKNIGASARSKLSLTSVNSVDEYGFLTPGPLYQTFHHVHKSNNKQNKQTSAINQSQLGMNALPYCASQKPQINQGILNDDLPEQEEEEVNTKLKERVEQDPLTAWAINVKKHRTNVKGQEKDALSVGGSCSRKAISLPYSTYPAEESDLAEKKSRKSPSSTQ